MATEHRLVQSGNRIEIQFDGKNVGLLQNLRPSDDYGLEPASGVGDIHVQEYVPSMARHHLTASTMVLFAGNLRDAGIAMENGDAVLKGLMFDICIYGKDPKNTGLLRFSPTSRRWWCGVLMAGTPTRSTRMTRRQWWHSRTFTRPSRRPRADFASLLETSLKARARSLSQSIEWWYRERYQLPATDSRFLGATHDDARLVRARSISRSISTEFFQNP